MRWPLFWVLWVVMLGIQPALADETVVQELSGSGTTTSGLVKVSDRWEVRWNARQVVSVAVMSSNGTIVAGAAGVLRGSLFVPVGGQYYFKISDGVGPTSSNKTSSPSSTNAAPVSPPSPTGDTTNPPVAEPAATWHVQVVELGTSVKSDQALTVYTPFFMVPDSVVIPVTPPPPPPPPVLSNDQIRAVVTIKGDNTQGTGFLIRSSEGVFVVTHLSLLAANPNLQISTSSGVSVKVLSLKGAVDRDLAVLTVKDDHFSCLPLATDPAHDFEQSDDVIIPDIGQQADVLAGKPGKIVGLGPQRIDFDNELGSGCSGAPVIRVKGGKALALVTAVKRVSVTNDIAQAWPANPVPGAEGIIPYFGLRLDDVPGWENYDISRFLAETLFLKQFHDDTRCLDSYLNGKNRHGRGRNGENGAPDNQFYANNIKLRTAHNNYKQLANGADQGQRIEAANELLSDLETIVDADVGSLQGRTDFYAYDLNWAKEELAYRSALKKELDDLSNNPGKLDNIARSH